VFVLDERLALIGGSVTVLGEQRLPVDRRRSQRIHRIAAPQHRPSSLIAFYRPQRRACSTDVEARRPLPLRHLVVRLLGAITVVVRQGTQAQ
jgi:hypothetical protein